ncbi:MAG: sigma-54-dependent transcriptional regulator [bacterium]
MRKSILIIDDEENLRKFLSKSLARDGFEVQTAGTGKEGLALFQQGGSDVIILDVRLPDMYGLEVLREILAIQKDAAVIMITAYGDIKTAVEAMKLGAADYLTKPFEFEEIRLAIDKVLKVLELKHKVQLFEYQADKLRYEDMIGSSQSMRAVFETIEKVAASPDTTVLIMGESGTGKELVAKAIHNKSQRKDKPFVTINCTALQEQLLESELFGHERGAFTDAKTAKKGLFEIADGGTIFLDEVGDMDVGVQAKLLRVLEERAFRRVGGTKDIAVNVRIIAASNKNLAKEVEAGRFRDDLYFRLQVVPITIPPLRERKEDIPLLVNYFISDYNVRLNRSIAGIAPGALNALTRYHWPGNVRELKNVIERIAILRNPKQIGLTDLPIEITKSSASPQIENKEAERGQNRTVEEHALADLDYQEARQRAMAAFEKKYLQAVLAAHHGNVSQSAQAARLDRSSLHRLMKKHALKAETFREQ